MKRSIITLTTIAALGLSAASPVLAQQSDNDTTANGQTEAQMFQAAAVSLQQATDIAMKEVPGMLAGIGFNDENSVGVYEAVIVGADGAESIVKIDANTGAVLGKGLASVMDDEGDDENGVENGEGENEAEDDNG